MPKQWTVFLQTFLLGLRVMYSERQCRASSRLDDIRGTVCSTSFHWRGCWIFPHLLLTALTLDRSSDRAALFSRVHGLFVFTLSVATCGQKQIPSDSYIWTNEVSRCLSLLFRSIGIPCGHRVLYLNSCVGPWASLMDSGGLEALSILLLFKEEQ